MLNYIIFFLCNQKLILKFENIKSLTMSIRQIKLRKELINQGWELTHVNFVLQLPPENEIEHEDLIFKYLDE